MRYRIVMTDETVQDYRSLSAYHRSAVRDAILQHLGHKPTHTSRSRIKRLRGNYRPQYRLRVDELRVFYRVEEDTVIVLGIVTKSEQDQWLRRQSANEK